MKRLVMAINKVIHSKVNYFIAILCFFSMAPTDLRGQSDYLLDNFTAFRDGNRVILTWTIGRGNSCIGIGVYRSADNEEYEKIHEIFGECGSTDKAQFYSYIDENPIKNKISFYVLELGFSGRTLPVSILFDELPSNGSKVVPNPAFDEAKIVLILPDDIGYFINIYNQIGEHIAKYEDKGERSHFSIAGFLPGNYFYTVTDTYGKRISSGKFVVIY
jgi:hypothetical protein